MLSILPKNLAVKLGILIQEVSDTISHKTLPKFGNSPKNLRIDLPRRIMNPERIQLGDNVFIGPSSLLFAMTHYPTVSMQPPGKKLPVRHFDSKIVIGNNVTATERLQISACSKVTIGDDVMFASNIHINDAMHGYATANIPYKYQNLWRIAPITIQNGCWIGQNVVILPGVEIGENCIIGANSVVTGSIASRSIAAGTPARIIKKWDPNSRKWVSVDAAENQTSTVNKT
ncbi:MAG TPA: acyltransferase [Thermodesulfobacteriaceae bacterium]|nr:acyltransferase [Thermodesulfobacteriaceae bacterium]